MNVPEVAIEELARAVLEVAKKRQKEKGNTKMALPEKQNENQWIPNEDIIS